MLLGALGVLGAGFGAFWARAVVAARRMPAVESPAHDARFPTALHTFVGAITNFFDTLGIGSFATTTAMFRAWRLVPDRVIPGTLNVGHTLPVIVQAFVYTTIIAVDILTLLAMITASVVGAWFGAGFVSRWSRRKVQIGMGAALLAAGARHRREHDARRAHDPRDRPLRALHDPGQPARHEPADLVPDHDGIVRLPHAGRQHAVHS
jgi:uncharacterized membrane protein YfcA